MADFRCRKAELFLMSSSIILSTGHRQGSQTQNDLNLEANTSSIVKKFQQRLNFIRLLRKFDMPKES